MNDNTVALVITFLFRGEQEMLEISSVAVGLKLHMILDTIVRVIDKHRDRKIYPRPCHSLFTLA